MVHDVVMLMRPRIAMMVAGATAFGFLLHGSGDVGAFALVVSGSFLLCAGCSALNQVQERRLDASMSRTAGRPVARGAVSAVRGLCLAVMFMAVGLLLYGAAGGERLLLVGLGIIAIYNGLYTPLKRLTGMAVLVGGVPGALPPYTGWLAAGGYPAATGIIAVCVIVYLWQVPHFWMLALLHRDDYIAASLPLPPLRITPRIFHPMMYLWIVAYFTAALTLPAILGIPAIAPWVMAASAMCGAGVGLCGIWGRTRRAMAWLNASLPLLMAAMLMG